MIYILYKLQSLYCKSLNALQINPSIFESTYFYDFMCYITLGLWHYLRLTYYHEAGKQGVNGDCKSLNPSSEDKFL